MSYPSKAFFSKGRSSSLTCHCSQRKGKGFLAGYLNKPELPAVGGTGRDNHADSTERAQHE